MPTVSQTQSHGLKYVEDAVAGLFGVHALEGGLCLPEDAKLCLVTNRAS